MIMHRYCKGILLAGTVLALSSPEAAIAQSATPNQDTDGEVPAAGEQPTAWIIVTAQRREERLQRVPIAITALTGAALKDQGVTNMRDLAQHAPSLTLAPYPNSTDTLSINMRGQGAADAGQITKDGGVGLYIDGFYIARPQGALFDLADPERVEVLRGPQGTLYGRNTTGGAINIITTRPSGEWGGGASITYGSRRYVRGLATVDLPAIGDLALRGSFVVSSRDGAVRNPGADHRYGELGQVAGRIAARWTPSPDFTLDYAFDQGRVHSTQPYFVNAALEGAVPGYVADRDQTYAPLDIQGSHADFVDHQLTLEWQASDSLTLRSLSAYRGLTAIQNVDYGVSLSSPFFPITLEQYHHYRTRQYTQEFQLIGSLGTQIEYTAGLYYFRESGRHLQLQDLGLIPFDLTVPSERFVTALSTSYAAYIQASWMPPILDDRLTVTAGGRYTRDRRSATRDRSVGGFPIDVDVSNRQSFSNFSPSINFSLQWTPDMLTYVRYSEGYKAGGSAEGGPDFSAIYGPESITSWEAGLKTQFFDNVVTFNAAVFHNRFNDLQLDFVSDPTDASIVATFNAGRAELNGLELELMVQPSRDLSLRATYSYLDPKLNLVTAPAGTVFDPLINPGSAFQVGDDVTGFFVLPFIQRHALSLSGDWTFINLEDDKLSIHGTYSYHSPFYTQAGAGPVVAGREFYRNEMYSTVNLRLSWEHSLSNGMAAVLTLFADNLFDRRSTQLAIAGGDLFSGYTSQAATYTEPRTIGVEARMRF